MTPKVRLYIRPTLPDGSRPHLDPVYSANHRLRSGYAVLNGEELRFKSYAYCLRYASEGKRVWQTVGTDAQEALGAQMKLEKLLEAVGVEAITPEQLRKQPAPAQAQEATPIMTASLVKHSLTEATAVYLAEVAEVKDHKSKKTHDAYEWHLNGSPAAPRN